MIRSRVGVGLVVFAMLAIPARLSCADPPAVAKAPGAPVLAVVDFDGSNKEMSRSLTETVWTELAQCDGVQVVACRRTRQVMAIIAPKGIDQLDDGAIKHMARALHADRIVIGSFMLRDDNLLINARILDAATATMIRGGACSAGGGGKELQTVCRSLAAAVLQKVAAAAPTPDASRTDSAPVQVAPGTDVPAADPQQATPAEPALQSGDLQLGEFRAVGLIPAGVALGKTLGERDLVALIRGVHQRTITDAPQPAVELTKQPVTRLRLLAGLVKAVLPAEEIPSGNDVAEGDLPPDSGAVPAWARGYVLAATQQGWIATTSPLQPGALATWKFVGEILIHVPLNLDTDTSTAVTTSGTASPDDTYTGLVIDAREMKVEPSPAPHVRDEENRVVYPIDGHIPGDSFVLDRGMVSYNSDPSEARRAGSHPLVVKALRVCGPGNDDLVVSDQDAELIRRANARTKFLWRWNVSFVVGASPVSNGSATGGDGSASAGGSASASGGP